MCSIGKSMKTSRCFGESDGNRQAEKKEEQTEESGAASRPNV
jgi:hypothetical protein